MPCKLNITELQALREQLAMILAPNHAEGHGGNAMEGLLEMETMLRGSFLRPQLERFFEGLEGSQLDRDLQVPLPYGTYCMLALGTDPVAASPPGSVWAAAAQRLNRKQVLPPGIVPAQA